MIENVIHLTSSLIGYDRAEQYRYTWSQETMGFMYTACNSMWFVGISLFWGWGGGGDNITLQGHISVILQMCKTRPIRHKHGMAYCMGWNIRKNQSNDICCSICLHIYQQKKRLPQLHLLTHAPKLQIRQEREKSFLVVPRCYWL